MHWASLLEGALTSAVGVAVTLPLCAHVGGRARRRREQEVRRRHTRARLQELAHELAENALVLARMARDVGGAPVQFGASAIARTRVRHIRFVAWELLLIEACDGVPLDLALALRDGASATREAVEAVESGAAAVRAQRAEVVESFTSDAQVARAMQTIETLFASETRGPLTRAVARVRAARGELAAHLAASRGAVADS